MEVTFLPVWGLTYRKLMKEYFREGAKWTAAPQPQMSDGLYVSEAEIQDKDQPGDWATTRFEPIFDAADRVIHALG